jgi:hypothetical protein
MATLRHPRAEATRPVEGNTLVPGRYVNSQIASSTMQDRQCNIKHAGIKGYEKARMQNERNRGHWIQDGGNSSQPGGPSKEGPADLGSAVTASAVTAL